MFLYSELLVLYFTRQFHGYLVADFIQIFITAIGYCLSTFYIFTFSMFKLLMNVKTFSNSKMQKNY